MHPGLAVLATAYLPMTTMLLTFAAELMLGPAPQPGDVAGDHGVLRGTRRRDRARLVQAGELHGGWETTPTALFVAVVLLCAGVAPGLAAYPRATQRGAE